MRHEFEVRCEGNGNQKTKGVGCFSECLFCPFQPHLLLRMLYESMANDVNIESTAKLNEILND